MNKTAARHTRVDDPAEHPLSGVLDAMGLSKADVWTQVVVKQQLDVVADNYARHLAALAKQPDRDTVKQCRKAIAKVLDLHNEIGPEFFTYEIAKAGWSRQNPDADDDALNVLVAETGQRENELVSALACREQDLAHWLNSNEDYRKRDLRKLVIEPVLKLMVDQSITTDRKLRPRKRIFEAVFDWLGVEHASRPTSANIDAIAKRLEAADPDTNQQPEN